MHAHAAAARVKHEGKKNDLLERLAADERFAMIDVKRVLGPKRFIGRAPEQVAAFNREHVLAIRRRFRNVLGASAGLEV